MIVVSTLALTAEQLQEMVSNVLTVALTTPKKLMSAMVTQANRCMSRGTKNRSEVSK